MRNRIVLIASIISVLCLCANRDVSATPLKLTVTSSAFKNGKSIPSRFGCDGTGISPPLTWSKVPTGTQSIAIFMVGLKGGPFYHWGTYNLAPTRRSIRSNFKNISSNDTVNDWGFSGYGEPCPPGKTHPYVFHVVALDTTIAPNIEGDYLASTLYEDVFKGYLRGHVLARGSIKGTYYSKG